MQPPVAPQRMQHVDALRRAAERGDADAWAQLALLHLRGDELPRDLGEARRCLRGAANAGHVDAAMMEAQLTANGSGGAADWSGALALLRGIAQTDPTAAQQLAMIDKMALTKDGDPPTAVASETLHERPFVARVVGLCDRDECLHIASLALPAVEPAMVADPTTGRFVRHPIRSADNAVIGPTQESLVVRAINRRIARATGTVATQGEPLTVLRYRPGQEYREHLDTLPSEPNQRVRTAILYLNDGYEGGETLFPKLPLAYRARAGDLLIFDNVESDGRPDPRTAHAGAPVRAGTKWVATRWIRREPIDPWRMSEQYRARQGG